MLFLFLNSST